MDIYQLMGVSSISLIAYLIWQHNNISMVASAAAMRRCQQEGVQLLDQTVLLKNIRLTRSSRSLIAVRRCYQFEFSSIGDYRYKGTINMHGKYVDTIELSPFKVE